MGATLSVDGKTDKRAIRIVSSTPDLSRWIEMHPLKDDDAPVWVNIGTTNRNKKMKYDGLRRILQKAVKKAGINKRIYPHLLRHTRGTAYANYLTEAQLDAHFGWVPGSSMHRTYVHLSSSDTEQAILALHGLSNKSKDPVLTFKNCPRCDTRNSPASNMCSKCGCPLDLKSSLDTEEIRNKLLIKITEMISKDPQVNTIFQENLGAA